MNKEKLGWTDWINAFSNIETNEIGWNNLQILSQFKQQILEENQQLKQRVAELTKTNIVLPKLERGETIYFIQNNKIERGSFQNFTSKSIECEILVNPKKLIYSDGWEDWDFDLEFIDHDKIYKTEEEALQKLKEMKEV